MKLLLTILALIAICSAIDENSTIFTKLDEKNYEDFISKHKNTLVLYHNNACHVCEQVKIDLESLYNKYYDSHPDFALASFNADNASDFVKSLHLNHFPHLRLFFGKDFHATYHDLFGKDHLEHFLDVHLNSSKKPIFIDDESTYDKFDNEKTALYLSFPQYDEIERDFAEMLQKTYPELQVYTTISQNDFDKKLVQDEKFTYRLVVKRPSGGNKIMSTRHLLHVPSVLTYINAYKDPIVHPISEKASERLFKNKLPAIILFDKSYDSPNAEAFRQAAEEFSYRGLYLISDLSEPKSGHIASLLQVDQSQFPTIRVLQFGYNKFIKFKYDKDTFTKDDIKDFIERYIGKKVKEYFKSEEPHDNTSEKVIKLANKNFESIVGNEDSNVLVGYFANYNHSSKDLHGVLLKVSHITKSVADVVVAKIDIEKNDVDNVNLDNLPAIQLFKKGEKSKPIKYTGKLDAEEIVSFLEKQLKTRFYDRKVPDEVDEMKETYTDL